MELFEVMIGRFDQSKLFALVLFFRHEIDVRKIMLYN